MALDTGARLGRYEIVAHLGTGGTGEVYRACDVRLGRDIAIKLLTPELLQDEERTRRFDAEAKAVAAVEHPNVLAIHDVGTSSEGTFIVTELLNGMTLDELLQGGSVSTRKALQIVSAAARGLAAAHERGIVHRDLKPSNVFLTRDGRVKLLDFGLAQLLHSDGHPMGDSDSAAPGPVLGTPNYMSPEQALGQPLDTRSDIFALGAILYELLSGQRAFQGPSAAEAMAAIVYENPPGLDDLTDRLPPMLGDTLHRCLEKDPAARFQSAHDLAVHLESIVTDPLSQPGGRAGPEWRPLWRRTAWLWLGASCLAAVAAIVLVAVSRHSSPPQPPDLRTITYSGTDSNPSAAPDGRRIAFRSRRDGVSRIWLKELGRGHETALTEGPDSAVRFSPDGTQILFVREEQEGKVLYRVSAAGGQPRRVLADVHEADWSPDGRQVAFLRRVQGPQGPAALLGVAGIDGSGEKKLIDLSTPFYTFPRWSPDGRWIALGHGGAGVPGQVVVVTRDDGTARSLDTGTEGRVQGLAWAGDGSLLVAQAESPSAGQRVTPGRVQRCRIQGRCRTIFHVAQMGMGLDVLENGVLVFGTESTSQRLLEVSWDGQEASERWLTDGAANDRQPVYSPDGEWIVFSSERAGDLDLWKVSRTNGALRRLTDDPAEDWDPAWTPDGRHLLWSSNRSGHFEIWRSKPDGSEPEQVTRAESNFQNPTSTPDGEWITFVSFGEETRGLWKARADGSNAIRLVAGDLRHPELSPDGRFVLFHRLLPGGVELIQVVRLQDGKPTPFEIRIPSFPGAGRGRWLPDGSGVAFIGREAERRTGVLFQAFHHDRSPEGAPRPVTGFRSGSHTESFGISPDARFLASPPSSREWPSR